MAGKNTTRGDALARGIVERSEAMLAAFEREGEAAAIKEWEALDRLAAGGSDGLPDAISNLLTEAGLFAEECPSGDAAELRHAIYAAKAFLAGAGAE